ncbi:phage portal protein [Clostridium gasigenes]|uniref:phage portal protein n=1 Tax=Clostridium gasigenes TaxID=94869 RepID=UPI0014386523|nr:phage portal protein [Clostridium gasigenes]NKF05296.1 phage portal protein [Clostridium gasigenes]QSW18751.1 phage portal protein [Clostridium gasigenes]
MSIWNRNKVIETREDPIAGPLDDLLVQADVSDVPISKTDAISIPAVGACVDLIAGIIAGLNVKLYKENDGKTEMIEDTRTFALNKNTGDTLNPAEIKRAMVTDYLLDGKGYIYINKTGSNVKSLNYVENKNISILVAQDPIFKDADFTVNGAKYLPFQFIKLLKNTKNGFDGTGIIKQNNIALSVAFNALNYEKVLLTTGGNKKGFLKVAKKLSDSAIRSLRKAWKDLYSAGKEGIVILNEGIDFKEAQATNLELQLSENKKQNNAEILKMFNVPAGLLNENATEGEYNSFIKIAILPLINAFESALNSSLLTDVEKKSNYYFAFDTNDLLKGSIKERMEAYSIGINSGIYTLNEVRNKENLEDIEGLNVLKMNLADVIFDIKTQTWIVLNMSNKVPTGEATKPIADTAEGVKN